MKFEFRGLPYLSEGYKRALWVLFIGLTVLLILWPAELKYDFSYSPIPYTQVFSNIPLMTVVYYAWLTALMVLLFTHRKWHDNDWERILLLCTFSLVFSGAAVFITKSLVLDAIVPATDIDIFISEGYFADASGLKYHGFPGYSLLGTVFCQISGMAVFDFMPVFAIFQIVLYPVLLYMFFKKALKHGGMAALAVLLLILGDPTISSLTAGFAAGSFAATILFATLMVFFIDSKPDSWAHCIICMLIILTTSVTHLVTMTCMFLIFGVTYIVQKFIAKKLIHGRLVLFCLLVPAVWLVWEVFEIYSTIFAVTPEIFQSILNGEFFARLFTPVEISARSQASMPAILTILWYLLPFITVGVGIWLTVFYIRRLKHRDDLHAFLSSAIIGILALGTILLIYSGIQDSIGRMLIYIGLFTIVILFRWIMHTRLALGHSLVVILVIVLFGVSFVNFLIFPRGIVGETYYSYELDSGVFVQQQYDDGEGIATFGIGHSSYYLIHYAHNASVMEAATHTFRNAKASEIWKGVFSYIDEYEDLKFPVDTHLLVYSEKFGAPFQAYQGENIESYPEWEELRERIDENNRIYANGFVEIFERTWR